MRAIARSKSAAFLVAVISVTSACRDYDNPLVTVHETPTVTVAPGSADIKVGETQQFTATVTGGNSVTNLVHWTVRHDFLQFDPGHQNNGIIQINNAGVATCLTAGLTSVQATYTGNNNGRGYGRLTCRAITGPDLIGISPATVDIAINRTAVNEHVCAVTVENRTAGPVTVTVASEHAGFVVSPATVTLQSGAKTIVTVRANGTFTQPFIGIVVFKSTSSAGTEEERFTANVTLK